MSDVLDFFTDLYHNGLGYSGINTARSALSAALVLDTGQQVGTHPLVCRFVKSVYQLRPAFPRYQWTWDVKIVLDYLSDFHPAASLSLKDLTLKLVILIALVTGQRGQSLHLMDLKDMQTGKASYRFVLQQKVKHSAPGRLQPSLDLPMCKTQPSLCVASVLKEYLNRTEDLRQSSRLFITYVKPHNAVSRDTISRWVRTVMAKAGLDIRHFAPHSTRVASTSRAAASRVPLDTILRTAGWTNSKTFKKFYKMPAVKETGGQFAKSVLKK